MADISVLSRLVAGVTRNVDISSNTLVVSSIKVGGGVSNTELTKTILDNLVTLQNGSDAGSLHNHDGRYFTETELGSSTASSGSDLIGDDATYSNFTPAAATVKGALSGIDAALGTASTALDGSFRIKNTSDNTKQIAFDASVIGASSTRTLKMPDANVDLGALTNSNISASAAIAYTKLNLSGSIVNADIAAAAAIAFSKMEVLTFNRVLVSNGSGVVSASSVTTTTLGYLDATSSIQTQLNSKIASSEKGANNGVATLDSGGKIPVSQLPNSVMELQGFFDPATTTLADGSGNPGDVWEASAAGSYDFGNGAITFAIGDWAVYAADGKYHKSVNSNAVTSVNGQTGTVILNTSHISENTNLYFTDERAQDAVGAMVANSSKVSLTYVDGTPSLTADIVAGSLVNADISASAAIAYSKLSLSGSIVNADISSSAAIAYSKLSLSGSIVNADIASGAAIAYSKLNLSNSIVAGDLTANSVTAAKVDTGVFDQTSITGGNGSAASVQSAPLVKRTMVAGESFAANTTFAVRFAISGETAGRVYKADKDASSSSKYAAIGLVMPGSAVSAGQSIDVVMMGELAQGSSDTPWSSGDVGKELFVGSSGAIILGASLANSANEAAFCIGVVQTTTKAFVDFKQLRGIA